jgi:hypothetical protein
VATAKASTEAAINKLKRAKAAFVKADGAHGNATWAYKRAVVEAKTAQSVPLLPRPQQQALMLPRRPLQRHN